MISQKLKERLDTSDMDRVYLPANDCSRFNSLVATPQERRYWMNNKNRQGSTPNNNIPIVIDRLRN